MRRWAFVFRPGWIALALVVVAFAYLCFTVLAPWQLGKNTKTSRENNQIAASLKSDPVPVTSLLPQADSAQWRRVTATGHYTRGVGAGAAAGGRRTAGVRGADAVRRRRRTDRARRPRVRATAGRLTGAADSAGADRRR